MTIETYDIGDTIKYVKRLYPVTEIECDICKGAKAFQDSNGYSYICPKCNGLGKIQIEGKTEDIVKEGQITKIFVSNNNGETGVKVYYKTTKDDEYMIPHEDVLSIIKIIDGTSYENVKKMYG